ncbi:hypothetical protein TNCV_973141 [Trichonephila clavipes]|nr:hypothetical protein TNCV_973141 [Trichonephila clavipes]
MPNKNVETVGVNVNPSCCSAKQSVESEHGKKVAQVVSQAITNFDALDPDLILRYMSTKASFAPRQPASSVERLANQNLGRSEVSDWLAAQHPTLTALV